MNIRLWFVAALAWALVGCEAGSGTGDIGLSVRALGSCPGVSGSNLAGAIDRLRVIVTSVDSDTGELYNSVDKTFGFRSSVSVGGIPVGTNHVVTLLGFEAGKTEPTYFARERRVRIQQDATTKLQMVLAALGRYTCITPPTAFTHRVFPAVTVLGDGSVLITGGFTAVTPGSPTTLTGASDLAFLYHAETGGPLEPLPNPMTEPRAAHGAVFVPVTEKDGLKDENGSPIGTNGIVLLFGGLKKLELKADGVGFATADALNTYEIYDVATKTFHPATRDDKGQAQQMKLKRAFPLVARLFDNSVLVAGGGQLPADANQDYAKADIWAPWVAYGENRGGLQLFAGNAPVMQRQHNGAAIAKLEDTAEGLSRYVIVGGTPKVDANNPNVEIFTQSSQQDKGVSGTFTPLATDGNALPPLFFPAIAPLSGKRFLLVGGVGYKGQAFQNPVDKAWVLTFDRDAGGKDKLTITPVAQVSAGCGARYFHSAHSTYEGDRAVILGGFADFAGPANVPNCRFDPERPDPADPSKTVPASITPISESAAFAAHRAESLPDDSVVVIGGMTNRAAFPEETGLAQVFVPPTVKLDPVAQ